MPLHPQARRLLDMIAVGGRAEWSVATRRAGLAGLYRIAGGRPDASVPVEDGTVPGAAGPLPARLYGAAGAPRRHDRGDDGAEPSGAPGLLFFHGGGFVAGGLDDHDTFCRALASLSGCRVLAVGYRLAPEHPFPSAIEDGLAAARAVAADPARHGLDGARLAIGGNSAGAGIAARVCQVLAGEGARPFAAQLLLCPVLDAEGIEPSWSECGSGYLLDAATMRADAAASGIAKLSPDDPAASPLREADLAGLPPAIIHTAEFDIVRDGGTAYAGRLAAAGIAVRHTCHPGTLHDFAMLTGLVPSCRPALERIAAELADALSGPRPC